MFSEFYEKFNFNKTSKEEKKDVVENTGEWFPEQHDNKIRGIDKVVEQIEDKIDYELSEEKVNMNGTYKNCKECGKIFISKRPNRDKYCSRDCAHDAYNRQQREYYKRRMAVKAETNKDVKKETNRHSGKIKVTEDVFNGIKRMANDGETCAAIASKFNLNVKTVYHVRYCDDYGEYCEKHLTSVKDFIKTDAPVVEEEETKVEKVEKVDNFDMIMTAVEIVKAVRNTEDAKLAVDKAYELLMKNFAK